MFNLFKSSTKKKAKCCPIEIKEEKEEKQENSTPCCKSDNQNTNL